MNSSIQSTIIRLLKERGVKKASLFGSYARGDQTNTSDIDILIEPSTEMNLISFIALKQDLEDLIKIPVDLVSTRAVKPELRKYITSDLKVLYDEARS
jgi:predicted nucleotidyltransferase